MKAVRTRIKTEVLPAKSAGIATGLYGSIEDQEWQAGSCGIEAKRQASWSAAENLKVWEVSFDTLSSRAVNFSQWDNIRDFANLRNLKADHVFFDFVKCANAPL